MNGGWWGKNLVTVSFYNGGGNMVKHSKGPQSVDNCEKTRFSETFLFSEITFWKKKTFTSLDNYSTLLPSTRITFQNKGLSTTTQFYNSSTSS